MTTNIAAPPSVSPSRNQQLFSTREPLAENQNDNFSGVSKPAWNRVTRVSHHQDPFEKRVHSGRFPLPPDYQENGEDRQQRSQSADFVVPAESRKRHHQSEKQQQQECISPPSARSRPNVRQDRNLPQQKLTTTIGKNRSASASSFHSDYHHHGALAPAASSPSSRSASSPTRDLFVLFDHNSSNISNNNSNHQRRRSASAHQSILGEGDQVLSEEQLALSLAWEKEKQRMLKLSSEQLVRKTMQMHFDVLRLRRKRASDNANVYRLRKCREFVAACSDCVGDVNLRLAILAQRIAETKLLRDFEADHNSSPLSKLLRLSSSSSSFDEQQKIAVEVAVTSSNFTTANNYYSSSSSSASASFFRSTNPEEDTGPTNAEPSLSKNLSLLLDALEASEAANDKLLEIAVHEKRRADENAAHIKELDDAVRSLQAGRVELLNLHAAQTENYEIQLSDVRIQLQDKEEEHIRSTEDLRLSHIDQANRIADLEQVAESLQINLENEQQRSNRAQVDVDTLTAEIRMLHESLGQEKRELAHNQSLLSQSQRGRREDAFAAVFSENQSVVDSETIGRLKIELEARSGVDRFASEFRQEIKFLNDRRRLSELHGKQSVAIETDFAEGSVVKRIIEKSKRVIDAVHEQIFAVSRELEQTKKLHEAEVSDLHFANQFKLLRAAELVQRAKITTAEEADSSFVLKRVLFHDFDEALNAFNTEKELRQEIFEFEAGDAEELYWSDDTMSSKPKTKKVSSNSGTEEGEVFVFEDEIGEDSFFFSRPARAQQPQPQQRQQQHQQRDTSDVHQTENEGCDKNEILHVSGGDDDAEYFFMPQSAVPKWHQVLSEAWAKQPPPSVVDLERDVKKQHLREKLLEEAKADPEKAMEKRQQQQQQQPPPQDSTRYAKEKKSDPSTLEDASRNTSLEQKRGELSSSPKPNDQLLSRLDDIENEVDKNQQEQQQQEEKEREKKSVHDDDDEDAQDSKNSTSHSALPPPNDLNETQKNSEQLQEISNGDGGQQQQQQQEKEIPVGSSPIVASAAARPRSALDDLANGDLVSDEMLEKGQFVPPSSVPTTKPLPNEISASLSTTTTVLVVAPAPPPLPPCTFDEYEALKSKIEKQQSTQKMLHGKLVRALTSGILGEKEQRNRQEILLTQYFEIVTVLRKYMLAAHQLVGVAKAQQRRASMAKAELDQHRASSSTSSQLPSQQNSRSSSTVPQKDAKRQEKEQDEELLASSEKKVDQRQQTVVAGNYNNTDNIAASSDLQVDVGDEGDEQQRQQRHVPPSSLSAPKPVENYAAAASDSASGSAATSVNTTTAATVPTTAKTMTDPTSTSFTDQKHQKLETKVDDEREELVMDSRESARTEQDEVQKQTDHDDPSKELFASSAVAATSGILPPVTTRRDRSIATSQPTLAPASAVAKTTTVPSTTTFSSSSTTPMAATPVASKLNTPRASPTKFNEDIMRMLEEARKAFQNADDEAQKLLHYLEPTPPPPPPLPPSRQPHQQQLRNSKNN